MNKILNSTLFFFCDWLVYMIAVPVAATIGILLITGNETYTFTAGLSAFGGLAILSGLAYAHATLPRETAEGEDSGINPENIAAKLALTSILLLVCLTLKFASFVIVVLQEGYEFAIWIEHVLSIVAGIILMIATLLFFITAWIATLAIQDFSQILSRRALHGFFEA